MPAEGSGQKGTFGWWTTLKQGAHGIWSSGQDSCVPLECKHPEQSLWFCGGPQGASAHSVGKHSRDRVGTGHWAHPVPKYGCPVPPSARSDTHHSNYRKYLPRFVHFRHTSRLQVRFTLRQGLLRRRVRRWASGDSAGWDRPAANLFPRQGHRREGGPHKLFPRFLASCMIKAGRGNVPTVWLLPGGSQLCLAAPEVTASSLPCFLFARCLDHLCTPGVTLPWWSWENPLTLTEHETAQHETARHNTAQRNTTVITLHLTNKHSLHPTTCRITEQVLGNSELKYKPRGLHCPSVPFYGTWRWESFTLPEPLLPQHQATGGRVLLSSLDFAFCISRRTTKTAATKTLLLPVSWDVAGTMQSPRGAFSPSHHHTWHWTLPWGCRGPRLRPASLSLVPCQQPIPLRVPFCMDSLRWMAAFPVRGARNSADGGESSQSVSGLQEPWWCWEWGLPCGHCQGCTCSLQSCSGRRSLHLHEAVGGSPLWQGFRQKHAGLAPFWMLSLNKSLMWRLHLKMLL